MPQFSEALRFGLDALALSGIKDEDLDANDVPPQPAEQQGEQQGLEAPPKPPEPAVPAAPREKKPLELPYAWFKTPVPYMIGSKEFLEDDYVGLFQEPEEEDEGRLLFVAFSDLVIVAIDYEAGLPSVAGSALPASGNPNAAPSGPPPPPAPPGAGLPGASAPLPPPGPPQPPGLFSDLNVRFSSNLFEVIWGASYKILYGM